MDWWPYWAAPWRSPPLSPRFTFCNWTFGTFLFWEVRTFRSRETIDWGKRSESFFLVKWWHLPKGFLPQSWLLALRSRGFVIRWWGQCLEVGRGKCLCLFFLFLIKCLLKTFLDKRASLMPSGKAGLAFHFTLRQCKTKSLPNDCPIKE